MSARTLISVEDARAHLGDANWATVDCRFSLGDPAAGSRAYAEAHIPGALYACLKRDLSGPVVAGRTGRHPLPEVGFLARQFSEWGIDDRVQVVAYDDGPGAMAARLWWLLRWLGHESVAVLDGGMSRWRALDGPVRSGPEFREARDFVARPRDGLTIDSATILSHLRDGSYAIVDARAPERFRGEMEPIDPVGGHIPGATNLPYTDSLTSEGRFRSAEELRDRYRKHFAEASGGAPVFYCGSGVTACHHLVAYAHAGLGEALLYPGSWSEWIADPARPVETGS